MHNMIIEDSKVKERMLEFLEAYVAHLHIDDSDKRLFINSIYVTGRDFSERICWDVENKFFLLKVELMSYIICVSFTSKQYYEYIEDSVMDSIGSFMREKESVYTSRENVESLIRNHLKKWKFELSKIMHIGRNIMSTIKMEISLQDKKQKESGE